MLAKRKILITGITGFVGSHMADLLLKKDDVEIYAIKRWSSRMTNLIHIKDIEKKIKFFVCNILDPHSVEQVVTTVKPDWIFHFAAESYVQPSWNMPQLYMEINILGTLNFLEALKRNNMKNTRFHVAGSGEEYGEVLENETPITEETLLRPVNPYAVSKVAQDLLCYEHYKSYGLHIVRTRAFNHEGPRRDNVFALPSFAYQIARIERKLQEPVIYVGDLTPRRNWTDVKDMIEAYYIAVQKCIPGELYLIGSDAVYTIRECLDMLIKLSTFKSKMKIAVDKKRLRPADVPLLVGDYTKFFKQTGWKPKIPFKNTLRDTLNYWRDFIDKKLY
jgi:GDP-4-dehydro-6-deoxy-D-mannose reductase